MRRFFIAGAVLMSLGLAGCNSTMPKNDCRDGVNYVGAVGGAVGGALVGSLVGKGTGNTLATIGGAAAGGYAGSKTDIGCSK